MKEQFQHFKNDKVIRVSVFISLIFTILVSILIVFAYSDFPPYIPAFNSMPWGEERLVKSPMVIFLPGVFLIIMLVNNMLSFSLYKKYALLARIISVNTILFIFLGFLAYLQIYFLIF